MLELQNLSVTRGSFTLAADLAIEPGARVAVIGASGSGKSTLLSLIAGFLVPDRGRILWEGRDITATPPGKRPVSVLFQDQNLFPHLTAAQNVGLGLRPDLRLSSPQRVRVGQVLEEVGLAGMEDRKPADLSGGQQGRVALARVLLRARPVLLLDEPFAALGPALKAEMLDLLARIAEETGATVLMVSHDPGDARRFAPQTILIEDGRAQPPQPTGPLLDDPPPGLRAYLG
ncbi:ATP-binding cassette domain-containing protein [Paracoccus siganidrum]|uniref:ATP-binding cassette domain-containing protein n=1 Tax=Paracoccus siganidrum TaxID=1276757 RepID=A0A419AA38_9RHOB|nr:ATP-binding cassette domain-containing protein [Paracoccus siganidrum]RJL19298.1 ATP-binding cassette domain-containing protein [Paracoccus siganidrum]RMC33062.1 thiamine ABC transporter ATP-binding protein [Paracoccus siganidrum]